MSDKKRQFSAKGETQLEGAHDGGLPKKPSPLPDTEIEPCRASATKDNEIRG